jgi:hypothetical protein
MMSVFFAMVISELFVLVMFLMIIFRMMIDDMNFVATNINNETPSINHVLEVQVNDDWVEKMEVEKLEE